MSVSYKEHFAKIVYNGMIANSKDYDIQLFKIKPEGLEMVYDEPLLPNQVSLNGTTIQIDIPAPESLKMVTKFAVNIHYQHFVVINYIDIGHEDLETIHWEGEL